MADIAKAYVQIIPSAEGIKGSLDKMFNKEAASAEGSGQKAGSGFANGFKGAVAGAAKVAAGAVVAAGTGIAAITKQAVDGFAEYEQLKGGVETLFKDASDAVLENSKKAYETAGISANKYMETSINFSGALLKSVGDDSAKAAALTDTAIKDMADQANKYGKSLDDISMTYTSLARGNTQTLDNLFGGMFAGTKKGLKEMLEYAEDYRASLGETVSYSADSYADIVSAIHDISEATGVYKTTADEAAGTVQGSLSMLSASWQNLVAGLANPDANLGELIGLTIRSAETALNNLLPVIESALEGISGLIERMVPMITRKLPELARKILPPLLNAATSLVNGLVEALPGILSVISAQLPVLLNSLMQTIITVLPMLVQVGFQIVETIANGLAESLPTMVPQIIEMLMKIIQVFMDNAPLLITAAIAIINGLITGLTQNIDQLVVQGLDMVRAIIDGLVNSGDELIAAMIQVINVCVQATIDNLPLVIRAGIEILLALISGIIQATPELIAEFFSLGATVTSTLMEIDWAGLGIDILEGICVGVAKGVGKLVDAVKGAAQKALDTAKSALGIKSPSRVFRDQVGQMIDLGLAEGIEQYTSPVQDAMNNLSDMTQNSMNAATQLTKKPDYQKSEVSTGGDLTIPVYIGNQKFSQAVVKANMMNKFRSGGR